MSWEIELGYIETWLDEQDDETFVHILEALEMLKSQGPALGRPLVDSITGSKAKNLKELRPASPKGTEIRILFAFDPVRHAIMLVAGDKSKGKSGKAKWSGWYKKAIPEAERLLKHHIEELRQK